MLLDFNNLIKKYNMDITGVIHIGGHYGEEHKLYLKNNIKNIVYFEPLKDNFSKLQENVDSETLLYNIALGSYKGQTEMFVETVNNGQSSSILEPKLHKIQYPHIIFNKKETVNIDLLDNINLENKYNMINIDVQGYELEVFKGATNTLKNVKYIISEINRDELYENCVHIEELENYLKQFGFKLIEQSWDGGTWGDGLFIKIQQK